MMVVVVVATVVKMVGTTTTMLLEVAVRLWERRRLVDGDFNKGGGWCLPILIIFNFNDGNYEKGGDEVGSNISAFETNQLFTSLEELKEWATNVGRENGVVILTQRSDKNVVGNVVKVFLKCDRGGEYKPTATVRRSGTTKNNCPFQLVAKYIQEHNAWTIRVICDQHNHDLTQHMHGHPYAMRLSQEEKVMVGEMYSNNMAPRDILAALREKDDKNSSSLVTLYNEGQKVRKEKHKGASPMNVLFQLLQEKGFVHDHRTNPTTNTLEDLFFIHPTSYTLYRAFPHVLIIDTTYNTNQYKMPFVQIVGVSSTWKTITIALSSITKEKEDNFRWVLTRLRQTLDEIMLPRVIITDRDLALMNACQAVFLNVAKLLCRCHIGENIAKHCKQSFVSGRNWEMFEKLWGILIKSPTVAEYEFNHQRFHDTLIVHHSRAKTGLKTHSDRGPGSQGLKLPNLPNLNLRATRSLRAKPGVSRKFRVPPACSTSNSRLLCLQRVAEIRKVALRVAKTLMSTKKPYFLI